jgi:hypothetical protein
VRKTPKNLNDLRVALQVKLIQIGNLGACLHDSCHKLSILHPHDVHTAPLTVGSRLHDVQEDCNKLGELLKEVRRAADKYGEFFSK